MIGGCRAPSFWSEPEGRACFENLALLETKCSTENPNSLVVWEAPIGDFADLPRL
jgi:hypothetical protein